jgi:class 3 adenylate cyclase
MIRRGDADIINPALWFSDLRDFTQLTETLQAQRVLTRGQPDRVDLVLKHIRY